jgi:hypothetical protein
VRDFDRAEDGTMLLRSRSAKADDIVIMSMS